MKERAARLIEKIPSWVKRSFRVLTYAFIATVLSFTAEYVLTGAIDLTALESVIRTYGFNMIMVLVVLFRNESED